MLEARSSTSAPTDGDIAAWALWMRAQAWSERTIASRCELVARLGRTAGREPADLDSDDVLRLLGTPGLSPGSRRTYYVSLRSWFTWLVASGRRADDAMATVQKPRLGRTTIKPLQDDHVRQLLESGIYARTRTMVLLAAYQGLRAAEIARVRGDDIDPVSQTLRVASKGNVIVSLPLHPRIADEALKYGCGYWFPQRARATSAATGGPIRAASVTTIVSAAMKRAGVPGTCHSLRHWHATSLLRADVDIRVIQELMRHATLATTERYLHVDDTDRRAGLLRLPNVG